MQRRTRDPALSRTLTELAPGSPIREAIERVMHAGRGALIVLGHGSEVDRLVSGGIELDVAASPQRIAELAKMDGAIIMSDDLARVVRANVQLLPDPEIPTRETGMRHRTAERVARQVGVPVVSVSESMGVISVYLGDQRHVLDDVSLLLFRANQALSTLERYRARLDEHLHVLTSHELSGSSAVRDVVVCLQRAEMLHRIADEVAGYVAELGTEGRLVSLQLDELVGGDDVRPLLLRDYLPEATPEAVAGAMATLTQLDSEDLLDADVVGRLFGAEVKGLDRLAEPGGWRLLARIPRLPDSVTGRLIDQFGAVRRIAAAGVAELAEVEGVGETRARRIRDSLSQIAASTTPPGSH